MPGSVLCLPGDEFAESEGMNAIMSLHNESTMREILFDKLDKGNLYVETLGVISHASSGISWL